jgi:hypothetical protein
MSQGNQTNYPEQVIGLYRGELYGERLFEALAARSDEPGDATLWRLLADVERLTAARLEAHAFAFGADHEAQLQLAKVRLRSQLEALATKSMREVCEYYQARVPDNVARLGALRADAPEAHHTLLTHVIAHSAVFGDCLGHWLAGERSKAERVLEEYLAAQSNQSGDELRA